METWTCPHCGTEHPKNADGEMDNSLIIGRGTAALAYPKHVVLLGHNLTIPESAGSNYVNLFGSEGCTVCLSTIVDQVRDLIASVL